MIQSRVIKTENIAWKKLQFLQANDFKDLSEPAKDKLKASILNNNFSQPFYVWYESTTDTLWCLDGWHRTFILSDLLSEGVIVPEELPATFIRCEDKKEAASLVLQYSSVYAKITEDGLLNFLETFDLDLSEVKDQIDLPEFDMIDFQSHLQPDGEPGEKIIPVSLAERFIVPPFSVLDTRQGYWQERKRQWHTLFNSQETREDVKLISKSGQAPAIYELRNKMRESLGRDPDWEEILEYAEKKGLHVYGGASVFDPVLCEIAYTWFCPKKATVIDPFAGGSARGIVASLLDHFYTGIDLREDQCKANYEQAMNVCAIASLPNWITGDSNAALDTIDLAADFLFSCPPYHDLEKYSDDPADLSNMSYEQFVEVYRSIIFKSVQRLKDNRFACFVVGDIRGKDGGYRDFVGDTVQAFKDAGMIYYNEIMLINVAGSMPIRVGNQFANYRKVGKTHQNVLVFYKGDPKKIKEEFPEINLAEVLDNPVDNPNIALLEHKVYETETTENQ